MELKKKHQEFKDYSLHLAGTVTKEDEDYLKELRVKSAHDSSVVFHENISFQELVQLYADAEYYWHFSGYAVDEEINPEKTEHLGIAPLEAMACAKPVIMNDSHSAREAIQDGYNGYICKTSDIGSWTSALSSLLNNPKLVRTMGNNAIKKVKKEFNWSESVNLHEKVFKKLIS